MAKLEQTVLEANRKAAMDAFLASDKTLASSGLSGGALMNAGYSGIIKTIEFVELTGTNITPRTNDQLVGGTQIGNEGNATALPSIVFEDGRTLALSALVSHNESVVNNVPCYKVPGTTWKGFIGKTLTCDAREADEAKASTRTIPGQAPRRTVPQRYELTIK